jgi:hypothetical protein
VSSERRILKLNLVDLTNNQFKNSFHFVKSEVFLYRVQKTLPLAILGQANPVEHHFKLIRENSL